MRPATFEYQRAASVAEAIEMLAENPGAKPLAGGHSLIPPMNIRLAYPEVLVDIGRLEELRGIQIVGGKLRIGALTTHAEVARSAEVQAHAPALAQAAGMIGDPQVRNWGTLGGNVAHADPASDPPTVLLALGATIHAQGVNGSRSIAAGDFFTGLFETALRPDELITAIEFPLNTGGVPRRSAYVKMRHPASGYAVVGVCAALDVGSGGLCRFASVAVGGAVSHATKAPGAEAALVGTPLDDAALDAAAQALQSDIADDVSGDLYAPADYRLAMVGVYLKRAVRAALQKQD